MSNTSSSQSNTSLFLDYIDCERSDICYGEKMNLVCVDKNCPEENKVFCVICKNKYHDHHKENVIPLKLFLNQLKNIQNQDQFNNVYEEHYFEKIDEIYTNIRQNLKQYVVEIAKSIKQIEQTIEVVQKKFKEEMQLKLRIQKNLDDICDKFVGNEYNNFQEINEQMRNLLKCVTVKDDKINMEIQPLNVVQDYKKKQEYFQKQLSLLQETLTSKQSNIIKELGGEQFLSKKNSQLVECNNQYNVQFSQNYLNSIHLKQQNDYKKIISSSMCLSGSMCLFKDPILKNGKQEVYNSFKIRVCQDLKNFVYVIGICPLQKALNYQFKFNDIRAGGHHIYGTMGGSGTAPAGRGIQFSHTKSDNEKKIDFHYKNGDIIEGGVCQKEKYFYLRKISEDNYSNILSEHRISIVDFQQDYFPFVALWDKGTQFEIL